MKDNRELEDQLEYQFNRTEDDEKRLHELEVEMMNINSLLVREKE
jgi:hypothetical protein